VIFAVFCADSLLLYSTLRALTHDSAQARPNFAEDFGELSRAASLGRQPMILFVQRRPFPKAPFTSAFLPFYFLLSKAFTFSRVSLTALRLASNRKASWNSAIASSIRPLRMKATARFAWASAKFGLILRAV